jgi:cob(I)alamin adenosyltransferase
MRIYTKTGDTGKTSLYSGERVYKHLPEISVVGNIDELQSYIGLVKNERIQLPDKKLLQEIQQDLYQIMGYISGAKVDVFIFEKKTNLFEQMIDKITAKQSIKNGFILPGTNKISAEMHILRTVCRRAEREVIKLFFEKKTIEKTHSKLLIGYFNRLSDLFYALAVKYEK